jgi:uracil-DNA glycosylase
VSALPVPPLRGIHDEIVEDPDNAWALNAGYGPVYQACAAARVVIIGQAPGRRAQESGKPWDDASGVILRSWLGVTDDQFYDPQWFAFLPMDFYYPGKGAHGDLPPRRGFAAKWHGRLLTQMPRVTLKILIGAYAQRHYLEDRAGRTLTETVRSFRGYLPEFFPLVHPSPLNFRWRARNPWFDEEVVPVLRAQISGSSQMRV